MRAPLPPLLLLALASCGGDADSTTGGSRREKPLVYTTNHPLQYCVERITGDLATVECIVPAGQDPLHWRPDRNTIAALQDADLIIRNGASAEPWVFASSLPASRIVNTTRPFSDQFVERSDGVTHSHGGGETHTHAATVSETWTDPKLLQKQASNALEALIDRMPDQEPSLRDNYRALAKDLEDLDERLRALPPLPESTNVATADEIYGYIARRTGWTTVDLALDPAAAPADLSMDELRKTLAGSRAQVLVWPSAPNDELRQMLARELSLESVVFSTCAVLPAPGGADYLTAMRANISRLARALGE